MKITVKEKSVWGNVLIYPVCDKANKFAMLVGAKTFNQSQLQIIRTLGINVEVIRLGE